MVLLTALHQFKNHAPCLFWVENKVFFLHFSAYSCSHCLFALRFSRSKMCLASFSICVFASEGCVKHLLKALFLFSIRSIRRHSASENQSGLFRISLAASSVAFSITYSSNLYSRSFDDRRLISSGERWLKNSLFFPGFLRALFFCRMELSIFWMGLVGVMSSLVVLFMSGLV